MWCTCWWFASVQFGSLNRGGCCLLPCYLQVSLSQELVPALEAVLAASMHTMQQAAADPGRPTPNGCEVVLREACALAEAMPGMCKTEVGGQFQPVFRSTAAHDGAACISGPGRTDLESAASS